MDYLRAHMNARPPGLSQQKGDIPLTPIWQPLGIEWHGTEPWYVLQVGAEVRKYRPAHALGLRFLMSICPDADFWRRQFPSRFYHGQKIDWQAACSHIMKRCVDVGIYNP